VREAARRGVVMDVADARVHCDSLVAQAALDQGFFPTTIGTDISVPVPERTVYRQNDLVSKFHAMGMPLEDAVSAITNRPARVLGPDGQIGSLAPGMAGDAAVFDQREGQFVWHDMAGNNMEGRLHLDTFMTIRDGHVAWPEGRLLTAEEF
jgi:dihydroorotase